MVAKSSSAEPSLASSRPSKSSESLSNAPLAADGWEVGWLGTSVFESDVATEPQISSTLEGGIPAVVPAAGFSLSDVSLLLKRNLDFDG
jgi:hypothetical protein